MLNSSKTFVEILSVKLRNLKDETAYFDVGHFAEIWCEIELEAFTCTRQSDPTNKQNKQNQVGECCCKVHDLNTHTHTHTKLNNHLI